MGCSGSQHCNNAELPAHKVKLHDFFISKYPITVKDFRRFVDATGYKTTAEVNGSSIILLYNDSVREEKNVSWRDDARGNARDTTQDNDPVIHISWNDAVAYCNWLSKRSGMHFRLPTEAEWEYAARGGNKTKHSSFSGGSDFLDIGWFADNSGDRTHKVGLKKANELGIYDMNGNVWEWCNDWFSEEYYAFSPQDDPHGPDKGKYRVLRGGSWNNAPEECTVYYRNWHQPDERKGTYGFRLAGDMLETNYCRKL